MNLFKKNHIYYLWVISLIYFCSVSFFSLSDNLYVHNFRQAQTALTTIFLKEDGFNLAYTTPFMGYPWKVPMEFPLFQWIVYFFSSFADFQFIKIGKTINILFHVLNNVLILQISRNLNLPKKSICLGLIFYNIIPFYLTYDNTFLIDPMSLTLSFVTVFILTNIWSKKFSYLFCVFLLLSLLLTSLTKITTFISVLTPLFYITLFLLYKEKYKINISVFKEKKVLSAILFWIISFSVALVWTYYADWVKGQNPLSVIWQSKSLKTWNFGTLNQRLSFHNWYRLISYSMVMHPAVLISTAIAFFYSLIFSSRTYKYLLIAYAVLYIIPPLLFYNLFLIHTYYSIINLLFLCLFYGQLIYNISYANNTFNNLRLYSVITFSILFIFYRSWVFSNQIFKYGGEPGIWGHLHEISFHPSKKDAILFIDPSQDPFLEYYFRCRRINMSEEKFNTLEKRSKLNQLLGGQKINLVCVSSSETLLVLPNVYKKYLEKYSFYKTLYDVQSNKYYNFFWN